MSALSAPILARADDIAIQRVLVEGARASQLGLLDAASAGSVDQKELALRAAYRPADMLEAVPGLIASQGSGEGKAGQFYLRGFDLDHGTDLATAVDDMPVNQRSHAHGQGWTDLNFLIPELSARLDYRKGPYSAREGDFASAGSAAITYANRLARDVASLGVGQGGHARAMLAASRDAGGGALTYALELLHHDGPWVRPDDYRKLNGVLRYSRGYANNGWSVTAMAYRGRWHATDLVPRRALDDGRIGRFGAVDDSDGGEAQRVSLSGVWRRSAAASASKLNAYLVRNRLDLWSNLTYFMDDPVNGDQFAQPDHRVTAGASALHSWHAHHGETASLDLSVGLQIQNDNVFNGLAHTRARQLLAVTRRDHIVETSRAAWIEGALRWGGMLRAVAGLRADGYRFRVRPLQPANARSEGSGGSAADALLSPSLNLAFGPWQGGELTLSAGQGFHSNDARAAVAGTRPLVRSRGMEIGLRTETLPRVRTALALYRLDFDSELRYLGDAGTTEAGAPSRRTGVEFSGEWKSARWLSVGLDAAFAHARARGAAAGQDRIPGALEGVGQLTLGASRLGANGAWEGSLRLRWTGPRPLAEDDSVRSRAGATLNGRLGYRIGKELRLVLEGYNLADRRGAGTEYLYVSRLRGEVQPSQDLHFHPLEPRSFRLTLARSW